jgi:hypothetical protein
LHSSLLAGRHLAPGELHQPLPSAAAPGSGRRNRPAACEFVPQHHQGSCWQSHHLHKLNQQTGFHNKDTPAGQKKQAAEHLAIAVLDVEHVPRTDSRIRAITRKFQDTSIVLARTYSEWNGFPAFKKRLLRAAKFVQAERKDITFLATDTAAMVALACIIEADAHSSNTAVGLRELLKGWNRATASLTNMLDGKPFFRFKRTHLSLRQIASTKDKCSVTVPICSRACSVAPPSRKRVAEDGEVRPKRSMAPLSGTR